jgi:UDP-N-acetylmuramoyl-tripeptide--D-alanyl-D-alanine ligase
MRSRTDAEVIGFGSSPDADVRVEDLTLDANARPKFALVTPQGRTKLTMQLSGAHHAMNAAAAAAVGLAEGLSLNEISEALHDVAEVSAHRMGLTTRADGLLVVDDAYNANPESMRAALDALSVFAAGRAGDSWAVLGEMRELGEGAAGLHEAVGRHAASLGIDHLVVVGPGAQGIARGARAVTGWTGRVETAGSVETATALVETAVGRDDVVLVKASNAIGLWRVAELLVEPAAGVGAAT